MPIYRGSGETVGGEPIDPVDADNADITGGAIDGTSIGSITPAPGSFTTLKASSDITDMNFKQYGEKVYTNEVAIGSININFEDGPLQVFTLIGNVSFSFTNPLASGYVSSVTVKVIQDDTGSHSVTWPAPVKWPDNGVEPTLTTSAEAEATFTFYTYDGGTSVDGALVGDNFA
jgi:hypothetical protein